MAPPRRVSRRQARRPSWSRAGRLYRLLKSLERQPQSRDRLLRGLRVGMRTFYRDLDLLRGCGIEILLESRKYTLSSSVSECLEKLPFPDPELSFADTAILAKGTAAPNRKLKLMLQQLTRG